MKVGLLSKNVGALGAVVSAMGCASCFPILGSLGATIGLGFLAQFEGVFINTLLPIFASISLIASIYSWYTHKNHLRGFLSMVGPIMVLATLFLFWSSSWSTYMFYFALALMFVVSIWDLVSSPYKTCKTSNI
jgi:mercuric ion transport protein